MESVLENLRSPYSHKATEELPSLELLLNSRTAPLLNQIKFALGTEDNKLKNRIKSGIILHGPPGTGKTLLCELICRAANRKIYFIGAGAARTKYQSSTQAILREIIKQISKEPEPAALIIDEIDAIGTERTRNTGEEAYMSLAFLKTLFQGLDSYENKPYIFGTTNHIGVFDKAVKRRFRTLLIDLPQKDKLILIIAYYLNENKGKKVIEDNVSISFIDKLAGYASSENLSGDNIKDIIDQTILNEETGAEITYKLPFGYTKGIWSGTELEKIIYNAYCQFLEEKHHIEKEEEKEKTIYEPKVRYSNLAKQGIFYSSLAAVSGTARWSYLKIQRKIENGEINSDKIKRIFEFLKA